MTGSHVLIVEDDQGLGTLLGDKFLSRNWQVTCVTSFEAANLALESSIFSHCVLDLNLGSFSGLTLIPKLLESSPDCKVVVLTGYASVQTTIEAIKLGAIYLMAKPSRFREILAAFDHLANPSNVRLDVHAKQGIDHHEREMILRVLVDNQFNISKTAEQLGMHRRTLQRKLKKV